jgi:hypothetical protein
MLMFLMDTTGSFSGVDQNSALTLATGLLDNLKSDRVKVPKFRLVSVNDPTVDIHSPLTDMRTFRNQLNKLYKGSHPGGGDWPERSMKALKKAIDGAAFGTVLCLFTDAPTHDLALKSEVITQKRNRKAQIFIFLTPDYDIKNSVNLASYRAYQEVSDRHTYIMSQTEPSVIKRLVIKYLQSTEKDCLTYGGPRNWTDIPNECQFPFEISGTTFDQCAVFGKNQPWCPTKVNGANVPTTTDWGWCGDCSGKMNPKCSSANHKTLTDTWRRIPGGKQAGSNSDQSLPKGWYRFKSGGHDAVIPEGSVPTGSGNGEGNDVCGTGGTARMLGSLPTHKEGEVERQFCFEYNGLCDHHKYMKVRWCPTPTKAGKPFYIYELKPTYENFGYCAQR